MIKEKKISIKYIGIKIKENEHDCKVFVGWKTFVDD